LKNLEKTFEFKFFFKFGFEKKLKTKKLRKKTSSQPKHPERDIDMLCTDSETF